MKRKKTLSQSTYAEWERIKTKWKRGAIVAQDERSPVLHRLDQVDSRDVMKLILIDRLLGLIYGQSLADQWINLPNSNPTFNGISPIEYILTGDTHRIDKLLKLLHSRYTS